MAVMPKRESELQRPRSRKGGVVAPVTRGVLRKVSIPAADKNWHPIAARIYRSLRTSGQSDFFQNSDWAIAYSLCDDLSRYKRQEDLADEIGRSIRDYDAMTKDEREDAGLTERPRPFKGGSAMKLESVMSGLSDLLVTEGSRRKLRLELHEPKKEGKPASVVALESYKAGLEAAQ